MILRAGAIVLVLAACTNSTVSGPTTTERPLLVPTESFEGTAPPSPVTAGPVIALGDGCPPTPIPFQPVDFDGPSGWDTSTPVWSSARLAGGPGIVEVTHGPALPEASEPQPITILGAPGTIGTISDGFVALFSIGSTNNACNEWALVAHPSTSLDDLRALAEHLTTFAVGEQTLDCSRSSKARFTPGDSYAIIDGVLELPIHRALQTSRFLTDDGTSALFAKTGLILHRGTAFDIVVPPGWRGRIGIAWGDRASPGSVVHVPADCTPTGSDADVVAFPGGFFAIKPVCAPIDIVIDGSATLVPVGIGTPCPGQIPVDGPTDT